MQSRQRWGISRLILRTAISHRPRCRLAAHHLSQGRPPSHTIWLQASQHPAHATRTHPPTCACSTHTPSRPTSSTASSLARPPCRALLAPPSRRASGRLRASSSATGLRFRRSLWRAAGRGLPVLRSRAAAAAAAAAAGSGWPARRCRGLTAAGESGTPGSRWGRCSAWRGGGGGEEECG